MLTESEAAALAVLLRAGDFDTPRGCNLEAMISGLDGADRLRRPLRDALDVADGDVGSKRRALLTLLRWCARENRSFWGWRHETWCRVLGTSQDAFFTANAPVADASVRPFMIAAAYLLGCFSDFLALGEFRRAGLAQKIFGRATIDMALTTVARVVSGWGYTSEPRALLGATAEVLLLNGSPRLEDLTAEFLDGTRQRPGISKARASLLFQLARVLAEIGILNGPLATRNRTAPETFRAARSAGVTAAWVEWVERWESTSTLTPKTRRHAGDTLLKAGRWLHESHPDVDTPEKWTRELAAEYVAVVDRMRVGDYVSRTSALGATAGKPISARTKDHYLGAMRQFFRDVQEWGWVARRFNPVRAFATPRSVKALIGPSPRTIADDVWAKLLWAGLNLTVEDLPRHGDHNACVIEGKPTRVRSGYYPLEMLRALAIVWLFTGLRSDEIVRLRLGCVRLQTDPQPDGSPAAPPVCMLDVPVHKTGHAFAKPVDPAVHQAVGAWEAVRPTQPEFQDSKTGALVQFLFCYRARPLTQAYLNDGLIPILCRKAGVPRADARGSISSHRARSTIASQLFNAREPMTLFELQAWLGHRSPVTTQHYVALTPVRLAQAYGDAGYFARNTRAISVLLDQQAVKDGTAAAGGPWRYYDLGHGFCTYEFFDQCPHRMACAKCDFYLAKPSARGQLLESKASILRLLQEIPLNDEECAAADGDLQAVDRLLGRLVHTPTPSGRLPVRGPDAFIPVTTIGLDPTDRRRRPNST